MSIYCPLAPCDIPQIDTHRFPSSNYLLRQWRPSSPITSPPVTSSPITSTSIARNLIAGTPGNSQPPHHSLLLFYHFASLLLRVTQTHTPLVTASSDMTRNQRGLWIISAVPFSSKLHATAQHFFPLHNITTYSHYPPPPAASTPSHPLKVSGAPSPAAQITFSNNYLPLIEPTLTYLLAVATHSSHSFLWPIQNGLY